MLTGWYSYGLCKGLAHGTASVVTLHAFLSIIILFFSHDGARIGHYRKKNIKTILQRASAIVIVLMLHMHLNAFSFIMSGTPLDASAKSGLIITELIYFGALLTHLAVSFSKSLISMGIIRNDRTEKIIDIAAYSVCAFLMITASLAIILFTVSWNIG